MIQKKMRTSQSRQKSYADKRRKDVEFQEDDHVFLSHINYGNWTCFEVEEVDVKI
ncbi:putative retrotransposon gag protein, partial [Trifolium medium]|nr:putative retrotransposon gag protein [Trifolium medium]